MPRITQGGSVGEQQGVVGLVWVGGFLLILTLCLPTANEHSALRCELRFLCPAESSQWAVTDSAVLL